MSKVLDLADNVSDHYVFLFVTNTFVHDKACSFDIIYEKFICMDVMFMNEEIVPGSEKSNEDKQY